MSDANSSEREAFEAWYRKEYWDFLFEGRDRAPWDEAKQRYDHNTVDLAWRSWQAARQSAPPQETTVRKMDQATWDRMSMFEKAVYTSHGTWPESAPPQTPAPDEERLCVRCRGVVVDRRTMQPITETAAPQGERVGESDLLGGCLKGFRVLRKMLDTAKMDAGVVVTEAWIVEIESAIRQGYVLAAATPQGARHEGGESLERRVGQVALRKLELSPEAAYAWVYRSEVDFLRSAMSDEAGKV